MPSSVQPSVGTDGDRDLRCPVDRCHGALGSPSSRAASGEVGHGCRRLRAGLLRGPRLPLRAPRRLRHRPTATSAGPSSTSSTGRSTTSTPWPRTRCAARRRALWIVEQDGSEAHWTFAELAARSNQVANWLREWGVRARRPDRPHARQPGRAVGDAARRDEARRGGHPRDHPADGPPTCATAWTAAAPGTSSSAAPTTGAFADVAGDYTRIAVGGAPDGLAATTARPTAAVDPTSPRTASPAPDDPLLLYFTSGTTARPKLVEHTHASYPVGHLSTMYWIGLEPGDVHLNISSPGWAKHAWSNVFAPWMRRGVRARR